MNSFPPMGIDLLMQALDVTFDGRKLAVAVVGAAISLAVAVLGLYLAAWLSDYLWLALLCLIFTSVVAWAISSLFGGAVARLSHVELGGGGRPSVGQALSYAFEHLVSLLLVPLALGLVFLGAWAMQALILWIVQLVPAVNSVLSALLYLPFVLVNMTILFVALFGGWLTPAIVAGEGTGPSATLRRLVAIARQSPGRLAAYFALMLVFALMLGAVLFGVEVLASSVVHSTTLATRWLGGAGSTGDLGGLGEALPLSTRVLLALGSGDLLGLITPTSGAAGLVYLLTTAALVACTGALAFTVFPLSSACAAHISLSGRSPAMAPPNAAGALRCRACGTELRPGAKFCGRCGTSS